MNTSLAWVFRGLLICGLCRCSRSVSVRESLPKGTYQIGAAVCASSGAAPDYPTPGFATVLSAFDDLSAHTWTVKKSTIEETLQDSDCQVLVTRNIRRNAGREFSLARTRHAKFSPPDCALSVTARDATYPVKPSTATFFQDTLDATEDILYVVARSDEGGLLLISADRPDLNSVWGAYGCAASDQIQIPIVKIL